MNLAWNSVRNRSASNRRRNAASRFRPLIEGLEERVVPSTMTANTFSAGSPVIAGAVTSGVGEQHAHANSRHEPVLVGTGSLQHAASKTTAPHSSATKTHHRLANKGHHHSAQTATPGTTTTTNTTPAATNSTIVAAPTTAAPAATTTGATTANPTILTLNLNPIDLNLLGLEVRLYGQDTSSPVTVTLSSQSGSGDLLGNLLTDVSGLLNLQGVSNSLNTVLNNVITLVNSSSLQVTGVPAPTGTAQATTPVLDAFIAPVHLNLLGAVVDTSPIHLQILAHSGSGLVLGNILTDVANVLNTPPKNGKLTLSYVEDQLHTLLQEIDAQLPNIPSAPTTPVTTPAGSDQILSLTLPPINLNLLGLILQTSTIQVNADAQSGNGDLLGNLLVDVLNTLNASQTDLNNISNELNSLLAKVVGVLNATSLSLPANALGSLTPTLQTLAQPNLIATGNVTTPQPILNLVVASNNGGPPVDVNLLGVVVTTSNIQAQLLAQPGNGRILGNLLYNVSHLLDPGGALGVLSILNVLGI